MSLSLGEPRAVAAPTHGMDQVEGHVCALAGAAQAVAVEHVALVELEAGVIQIASALAVANQAADIVATLGKISGETAADEAGDARDERLQAVQSSRALRSQATCRLSSRRAWSTAATASITARPSRRRSRRRAAK